MLYAILVAILLIADQWVKYWTTVNIVLETGEASLIPGIVKLVNVHNSGAAFGFMSSVEYMRWIFAAIAIVVTVLIAVVMIRRIFPGKFPMICCAAAIAGALGNCIDRFIYGYVVDMFKLEFINFAVFNVADILLTVSCFLFIFYLIFGYKSDGEEKTASNDKASSKSAASDGDIDLGELSSLDIEESEPAKPIEIDSAFWASDKEPVKKHAEASAPAPKAEPGKAAPVEDTSEDFDLDSILGDDMPSASADSPVFDEFSIDSIIEEFK